MKRLRIVSDGTTPNTKVFVVNEFDGSEIDISELVQAIRWEIDACGETIAKAHITLRSPLVQTDVKGEANGEASSG